MSREEESASSGVGQTRAEYEREIAELREMNQQSYIDLATLRSQVASIREYIDGLPDDMNAHVAFICGVAAATGHEESDRELVRARSILERIYRVVEGLDMCVTDGVSQ